MMFKEITLEDKEWINPLLAASDYRGCDYTFANLFIWKDQYREEVASVADMFLARSRDPETGKYGYLFPAGAGDLKKAVEFLMEDAATHGEKLYMRGFTQTEADQLNTLFPDKFTIRVVRDEWDYIYSVEDLTNLAGKKYHGKRNHISKFQNIGEWRYEPLSEENVEACHTMCEQWYQEHVQNGNLEVLRDKDVVENALRYYKELGMIGGVLYQFGQVVAVSIGEPLNSDTYAVHVEKAFADIQGAYPMINQQYVIHNMQDFRFVNREEDDGIEGLKRAKESYYPVMMVEKCIAIEK